MKFVDNREDPVDVVEEVVGQARGQLTKGMGRFSMNKGNENLIGYILIIILVTSLTPLDFSKLLNLQAPPPPGRPFTYFGKNYD